MKIKYIVGIVLIAVAVGIILTSMGDASKYVSFKEAYQMSKNGNSSKIHVMGTLKKDPKGNILGIQYNPALDANLFSFLLIDKDGQEERVYYHDSKPQDFERSEEIVIVGGVNDKNFVADKIIMKCPSKYKGKEDQMEIIEAQPQKASL